MSATLPPLRDIIARHDLRARKSLGQHFLLDQNITDKIARAANLDAKDRVIEIGPGPGGLTRSLLALGVSVTAIERDERFTSALADLATHAGGALTLVFADALKVDYARLALPGSPVKIIANLPYNVGTTLLINWLTAAPLFWSSATLMFQKEVAERVCARPGAPGYGRLAVLASAVADTQMLFGVPAAAFSPPPKVDSAVIHLTPKPQSARFADLPGLTKITQAAFGQRRKMLRASLKPCAKSAGLNVGDWLEEAGIAPTERPENIAPEGFFKLVTVWRTKVT